MRALLDRKWLACIATAALITTSAQANVNVVAECRSDDVGQKFSCKGQTITLKQPGDQIKIQLLGNNPGIPGFSVSTSYSEEDVQNKVCNNLDRCSGYYYEKEGDAKNTIHTIPENIAGWSVPPKQHLPVNSVYIIEYATPDEGEPRDILFKF